jgi:ATP-dependent protease ClpP protease subunit
MATKRIEIRGVILDASFDFEWLDKYVEKGVFTPESRIRSQLKAAAEAGDDVELYISSQGGSIVAGNEIIAAFADYPHGKSITVGALAASMAANIALQAGVPVRAHNNTLFLFHGAWGVTIGGKDAHGDSAKMLAQINEPIRAALAAKGVPADVIEAGFGEGRELTMTATEAKEWGIVSEIIDEPAPWWRGLKNPTKTTSSRTARKSRLPLARRGRRISTRRMTRPLQRLRPKRRRPKRRRSKRHRSKRRRPPHPPNCRPTWPRWLTGWRTSNRNAATCNRNATSSPRNSPTSRRRGRKSGRLCRRPLTRSRVRKPTLNLDLPEWR